MDMAFKRRKERGLKNVCLHFKSSGLELMTGSEVSRTIPGWFRYSFEWTGFKHRAPCPCSVVGILLALVK